MWQIFVHAGLSNETGIFNLGYGSGYSINNITKSINHVTGLKTDVKYIEADTFNVKEVVLDISKSNKNIWLETEVDIRRGYDYILKMDAR